MLLLLLLVHVHEFLISQLTITYNDNNQNSSVFNNKHPNKKSNKILIPGSEKNDDDDDDDKEKEEEDEVHGRNTEKKTQEVLQVQVGSWSVKSSFLITNIKTQQQDIFFFFVAGNTVGPKIEK